MNDRSLGIITVGDKDLSNLLGLDIVAFQIAESGAMGYHGGVFFITTDKKAYYTCYLSPSAYTGFSQAMSWDNLTKVFPPLPDYKKVPLGIGLRCLAGWHYEYLGVGNHLIVREDMKERFLKAADKLLHEHPGSILYSQWMAAILSTLD